MAHPAPFRAAATLTPEEVLGQQLLTALLRENIAGLDRQVVEHSKLGPCTQHQGWWLPLQRDGLWHPWQARTPQVWHAPSGKWHPALDFVKTLHLGAFPQLEQEFHSALQVLELQQKHRSQLMERLRHHPDTLWEGLWKHDLLASLQQHPIYPLPARLGLEGRDLERYSPESSDGFLLRWVAVPRDRVTVQGPQPQFFPTFAQVGLSERLDHVLFPVHPHTLPRLGNVLDGVLVAPAAFLKVRPTLSLRTVVVDAHPDHHLKLPLKVATLGHRNLRTLHPDSFQDGMRMQQVLEQLAPEGIHFTREDHFAHAGVLELGYLLRTHPPLPEQARLIGLAGLLADHPAGTSVLEQQGPDPVGLLRKVIHRLLEFHLSLAMRHGMVLEAHQQNTTLVLTGQNVELMLRDNDSPRILWSHFSRHQPTLARHLLPLGDDRIPTDHPAKLLDMFITIVLHLCVTSLLKQAAMRNLLDLRTELARVRRKIHHLLQEHQDSPFAGVFREGLLEKPHFPSKPMLSAGTLFSKAELGIEDINKCYRHHSPNYLRDL